MTASFAGRTVSRVGYGAMQLERLHDRRGAAVALLRRAVELGVDHVDTAEFYGFGFVNDVIRETLRPEDGVLVVTKVGADPDPGGRLPLRVAQRPSSCAPASRPTCAASASTSSRWSTSAASTPVPACVPGATVPALTAHRTLTVAEDGPRRLPPGALDGRVVLAAGGAGAVGHAVIQLARWAGATVISTISGPEKVPTARSSRSAFHSPNARDERVPTG